MTRSARRLAGLAACAAALAAAQPAAAQREPVQLAQAAPPGVAPAAPAAMQTPAWESFPTMLLERVYRGPLKDTVVQRWRDQVDGTVCFLYIPISTPLLPQQAPNQPYVQYGPNAIGTISCVHPTQMVQLVAPPQPAPARPAASAAPPPTRAPGR